MNDPPCTDCGAAYAPFGYGPAGVSFTREPEQFRFYCREHRPEAVQDKEKATCPASNSLFRSS